MVDPFLAAADDGLRPSDDLAVARTHIESADIDPAADEHRDAILDFVARHPDALFRSCRSGHLTGSALVVDHRAEHVVMLHHRKLRRWLQPGGHCDGDANLAGVALREAREETGIEGLRVHPVAIDLDVHHVDPPAEGLHLHHDARFLVVAPESAALVGNHESTELRWVRPVDLGELGADVGTVRMVRHGLEVLRGVRG